MRTWRLLGMVALFVAGIVPAPSAPACAEIQCRPCPVMSRLAGLVLGEAPFHCAA